MDDSLGDHSPDSNESSISIHLNFRGTCYSGAPSRAGGSPTGPADLQQVDISTDPWAAVVEEVRQHHSNIANRNADVHQLTKDQEKDKKMVQDMRDIRSAIYAVFPEDSHWRRRIDDAMRGNPASTAGLPPVMREPPVESGVAAAVSRPLVAARDAGADREPPISHKRKRTAEPAKRPAALEKTVAAAAAKPPPPPSKRQRTGSDRKYSVGDILLCKRSSGEMERSHVKSITPRGYDMELHVSKNSRGEPKTKEIYWDEADEWLRLPEGIVGQPEKQPGYEKKAGRGRSRTAPPCAAAAASTVQGMQSQRSAARSVSRPAKTPAKRQPREGPVPARNGFHFYKDENKAKVREQVEDDRNAGRWQITKGHGVAKQVDKKLAEQWKNLDKKSAERKKYEDLANKDKERFAKEQRDWRAANPTAAASSQATGPLGAAAAAAAPPTKFSQQSVVSNKSITHKPPVNRLIADDDDDSE